jgi:hypothetical protein
MNTDLTAGLDDPDFWRWALPLIEQITRGGAGWPPGALANAAVTIADQWIDRHAGAPTPRLIALLLDFAEAEAREPDQATAELAATATGDPSTWTTEQAIANGRVSAFEMVGRARSRQWRAEPVKRGGLVWGGSTTRRARSSCGGRRRPGARRTSRAHAPPGGDADPGGDPDPERRAAPAGPQVGPLRRRISPYSPDPLARHEVVA